MLSSHIQKKDTLLWELDPFLSTSEMAGRQLLSWVQLGMSLTN
jgi:hypothetical protein